MLAERTQDARHLFIYSIKTELIKLSLRMDLIKHFSNLFPLLNTEFFVMLGISLPMLFLIYKIKDPKKWTFLKIIGVLTAFIFPLFFSLSWQSLLGVAITLLFIFLEYKFPREKASYLSSENIMLATYTILRQVFRPLIFTFIYIILNRIFKWHSWPTWQGFSEGSGLVIKAVLALLVIDFKTYWLHRAQHHFNFWWAFHKTHHSTRHLNILASNRDNLFEVFVTEELSTMLIAYFFGLPAEVFLFAFLLPQQIIGAYFGHANIKLTNKNLYWWQYIIVSPDIHGEHHVQGHEKCNYSTIFIFWDILFGTFRKPSSTAHIYGLGEEDPMTHAGLFEQILMPFKIYFFSKSK